MYMQNGIYIIYTYMIEYTGAVTLGSFSMVYLLVYYFKCAEGLAASPCVVCTESLYRLYKVSSSHTLTQVHTPLIPLHIVLCYTFVSQGNFIECPLVKLYCAAIYVLPTTQTEQTPARLLCVYVLQTMVLSNMLVILCIKIGW